MAKRQRTRGHGAYTLVELLVVLVVILIMLAVAVPLLGVLRGSNSIESAHNQISAMVHRAREQGMAQQDGRGVFFFRDPVDGRMAMAVVRPDDPTRDPRRIELDESAQIVRLPPGVGLRLLTERNVHFDLPGVVWFDGQGHLIRRQWSIGMNSDMARRAGLESMVDRSRIGLALFDDAALRAQHADAQQQWLLDHAAPVLINRYNGTLLRGE